MKTGKRWITLALVLCLIVSSSMIIVADEAIGESGQIGVTITPIVDYAQAEHVINFYGAKYGQTYTIADAKVLKSLSGGDDAYTLYTLEPYGYAILLNETYSLMEACYVEGATAPIDVNSGEAIYYGGPVSFFTKSGDTYTDVSGEYSVTAAELDLENSAEASVRANEVARLESKAKTSGQASVLSTNATVETFSVMNVYFSNLTEFGTNFRGTCTVLATAILLGFYDYYYCDHYVDSRYESGNGTNQTFHYYLCNYVYGTSLPENGAIKIRDTANQINTYLDDQSVSVDFEYEYISDDDGVDDVTEPIIAKLTAEKPVVASTYLIQGVVPAHTWVIYSVSYDPSDKTGTAVYTAHRGWHGTDETEAAGFRAEELNCEWVYEYGYIECEHKVDGYYYHSACKPFSYFSIAHCSSYCECGAFMLEHHEPDADGYCEHCGSYIEDE